MDAPGIADDVAKLLPEIVARRDEIERGRRLPADLAGKLCATRVFALGVPRDLGGVEAAPADLMAAIETIAAADGSAGWCAMVGIGNNVVSGYMPAEGAREVFADPTLPTAGIAAPAGTAVRTAGGVVVSGRWPFASGITHSDWVWAGALVTEDGAPRMTERGPEIVHVCMPVRAVEIEDTWHVSGLCGSGSHHFRVAEVFVPDTRTFALLDPAGHRPEPLYRMPPLGLFASQLACVGLGIARAAIDEVTGLAATRVPSLYTEPLALRPAAQIDLARAEAALGGARAFLHAATADMWTAVCAGGAPSGRQVALARAAQTQAVETAAAVARTASTLAGGVSLFLTSALQRHVRDTEAMTHHFTVAPPTWEQAGRVLLGQDPGVPAF